jgi:hypothetical protein
MYSYFLPQWPNPSVNRTAGKQRLPVPSALRAPVAGYVERWAPSDWNPYA